jgi:SAM-dependent methyltransferase
MVEEFSRRLVTGWVSVPRDAPPTRVSLHLGDLELSATYATADAAMSGWQSATRGGAVPAVRGEARETDPRAELQHNWQVPMIEGPADDRRNSRHQIRTFSFRIRGIWPFVKKSTRISVRVNGRPLPIYRHGMFLRPPKNGKQGLDDLRALLEQGHVLSQHGRIELSKQHDEGWQEDVITLYQRVQQILRGSCGHDIFLIYGTLLGAVREGGYIAHDVDFDAAYISGHRDPAEAARELQDIGLLLVREGLAVECFDSTLHISLPDRPENRIDLFHLYFDTEGLLRFPFGVAGSTPFREQDWQGCREVDLPGGRGLVPVAAEQLVEHIYGADWRQPKPGFNWALDRTDAALEARLTTAMRTKVYWANFYATTSYTSGSTFFEFVNAREDLPGRVIDIGCGDGRDSCAFASAGRTVLGLDQSPIGIEHATARAAELDMPGVRFEVCDVADVEELGRALDRGHGGADEAVLFYMRFFLHAIPEDVQERLMDAIDTHARSGDLVAAEFRTDKDEARKHVHEKHYRRFQNAEAFGADLRRRRFEVLHEEEGTGLSPYRDEDPVLYRVVARRG